MGPGATKVNFFEAPSPGDEVHNAMNVGPLQIGISCKGTATGETEIKLGTFLTVPGPMTMLMPVMEGSVYTKVIGSVTDVGSEQKVAEKENVSESGSFIVAGANGVPYWLWISYGANTEEESETTDGLTNDQPRGCWLLAEEI